VYYIVKIEYKSGDRMIRLRALRQEQNISMKQLGDIVGVAESTISLYETEKRKVDTDMLIKFANYFNVSTDYLLGVSDERNSSLDSDNIGYDDFTYAMHNESRDLTDEDKEMLLDMAKMLKNRIDERKRKE
jgi:transcriptional regulator with XRE-family HTH domain